jgi:hypothetical protein
MKPISRKFTQTHTFNIPKSVFVYFIITLLFYGDKAAGARN